MRDCKRCGAALPKLSPEHHRYCWRCYRVQRRQEEQYQAAVAKIGTDPPPPPPKRRATAKERVLAGIRRAMK